MQTKQGNDEKLYRHVKENFWIVRNNSTLTLSTTCRQLGLGLGGICWLIKSSPTNCQVSLLSTMILIFVVIFFLIDACQYLSSLINYQNIAEEYDLKILTKKITEVKQLCEPKGINTLSYIFFILKIFILFTDSIAFIILMIKL